MPVNPAALDRDPGREALASLVLPGSSAVVSSTQPLAAGRAPELEASVEPIPQRKPLGIRGTTVVLTAREREVAAWLGEDITCEGIARRLGVSRETIRAHLRNMARKLGVRTRHAMVARLAVAGLPVDRHGLGIGAGQVKAVLPSPSGTLGAGNPEPVET